MTTNYKSNIEERLTKAEQEWEERRDNAEAEIVKLIGAADSVKLFRLRSLFQEWEESDSKMAEITERIQRLY
jgi:hypothetical protein